MATGCVSLAGSAMCGAYGSLYINPTNLAASWPFFRSVTNVTSFDTAFAAYLAPTGQFAKTKQLNQLDCDGYQSGFVLQYSQSFLCGQFTQLSYSAACNANVNLSASMTCQSTCFQFADSETNLVNDTLICPTAANATREATLTRDFTSCTDWTTLATNDTATCIQGDTNEGNCGFRSAVGQLCSYCNPDTGLVNPCCANANTDLTTCGYSISAAQVYTTPTSGTGASQTSTAASQPTSSSAAAAATSHHRISKGAIAGAVIGSIIGAILLLLLLLLLLRVCLRRRSRSPSPNGIEGGPMMAENSPQSQYYNNEKPYPGGTTATGSTYGQSPVFPSRPQQARTAYNSPSPNHMGANAALISGAAAGAGALAYGAGGGGTRSRTPSIAQESMSHKSTITGEGGRILVPAFQDLYSDQIILPGSHVVVLYAYKATLGDELSLAVGESIQVINLYDDDWASGRVIDAEGNTLAQGAFPLVCVSLVGGDTTTTTTSPESSGEEVDIPQRGDESAGAGYATTTADEYATAAEDNEGFMTADESDVPRRRA